MPWRTRALALTPLLVLVAAAAASHLAGVRAVVALVGGAVSVAAVAVALAVREPPNRSVAVGVGVLGAALTIVAVCLISPHPPTGKRVRSTVPAVAKPVLAPQRPQLRAASLRRADLSAAVLTGADLSGADLRDANLAAADLRGACLRGTDLTGVNWRGARYDGADFTGATGAPTPKTTPSPRACALP